MTATPTAKDKLLALIRSFGAANASGDPGLMQYASTALGAYLNNVEIVEPLSPTEEQEGDS